MRCCYQCGTAVDPTPSGRAYSRARCSGCVAEHNLARSLEVYGLTPGAYRALLAGQDNACAICKTTTERLVVDHCHATGRVRGLLCRMCNLLLGHARDSEEILLAAVSYLGSNSPADFLDA